MQIPTTLADITPDWLTQILTASGTINQAKITAIESKPLGEGQGFVGQIFRLSLAYHIVEEGTPDSIVAKISQMDPGLRKKLSDWGFYKREINFYKEVANQIDLRTPHCYYAALDEETGHSVLLLEDLQDGRIGDTISGCSRQETECAVEHLAQLHVAWWEHSKLESLDWIFVNESLDDPREREQWQQQRNDSWTLFTEKFKDRIPLPVKEAWPVFVQHGAGIRRESLVQPLTLCHGDYRLDNFFFGNPDKDNDTHLVIFDWQTLRRAQGALDLSHFLIWNLEPELRRQIEKNMLEKYCSELKNNGIEGYSVSQCYRSYQITLYDFLLMRMVGAGAALDVSSDRAQTLFSTYLTRTSEAIIDHPIVDLIE